MGYYHNTFAMIPKLFMQLKTAIDLPAVFLIRLNDDCFAHLSKQ